MSADVVTEARRLLEPITPGEWRVEDGLGPGYVPQYDNVRSDRRAPPPFDWMPALWIYGVKIRREDAQFIAGAPRLVRGLLAEVDRLRDGGSMASAPRKDAASQAAEPAVLHASIDPPAVTPMSEQHESRSVQRRKAVMRGEPMPIFSGSDNTPDQPRCRCTHRWAEHYGPCQRPGCGCQVFVEPNA